MKPSAGSQLPEIQRQQRPGTSQGPTLLGCPAPHAETKARLCQVCAHPCLLPSVSLFSPPLFA